MSPARKCPGTHREYPAILRSRQQPIDLYTPLAYIVTVEMLFSETPAFTAQISRLLDDDEYACLQMFLTLNPKAGPRIPGGKGFRKLRWSNPKEQKGKRGGVRVIYYLVLEDHILMVAAYPKSSKEDLSKKQLQRLLALVFGN